MSLRSFLDDIAPSFEKGASLKRCTLPMKPLIRPCIRHPALRQGHHMFVTV